MKKLLLSATALGALAVGVFAASPASAVTLYGTLGGWSVATQFSTQTTTTADADGSTPSTITLAAGSVLSSFSSTLTTHIVGTSWSTWQGQPGTNGTTVYAPAADSVTMNFGPGDVVAFGANHPVNAFGFFVEPDQFAVEDITLTTSDGSVLTQSVNGSGGATFFGWVGGGVSSLTISNAAADNFAFGDFYEGATASVPEPATLALLGVGLLGLGLVRRRS